MSQLVDLRPVGTDAAEGLYGLVDAACEKRSIAVSSTPARRRLRPADAQNPRHCSALRPRALQTPDDSIRHTLRSIAKRWLALDEEVKELVAMIEQLVVKRAPHLLDEFGIGVDTAAEILIVAGDNPERIHSEAAFAKLAGISPIPTGSGMTSGKHRINHGGHRQLNAAIYRVVIGRMRFHEPTIDYVTRRTAEGKSKRDIIRCLKRYVIREVYHLIIANPKTGEIAA